MNFAGANWSLHEELHDAFCRIQEHISTLGTCRKSQTSLGQIISLCVLYLKLFVFTLIVESKLMLRYDLI